MCLDLTAAVNSAEPSAVIPQRPKRQTKATDSTSAADDDDDETIGRVNTMIGRAIYEMMGDTSERARTLNALSVVLDGYSPPNAFGAIIR